MDLKARTEEIAKGMYVHAAPLQRDGVELEWEDLMPDQKKMYLDAAADQYIAIANARAAMHSAPRAAAPNAVEPFVIGTTVRINEVGHAAYNHIPEGSVGEIVRVEKLPPAFAYVIRVGRWHATVIYYANEFDIVL